MFLLYHQPPWQTNFQASQVCLREFRNSDVISLEKLLQRACFFFLSIDKSEIFRQCECSLLHRWCIQYLSPFTRFDVCSEQCLIMMLNRLLLLSEFPLSKITFFTLIRQQHSLSSKDGTKDNSACLPRMELFPSFWLKKKKKKKKVRPFVLFITIG